MTKRSGDYVYSTRQKKRWFVHGKQPTFGQVLAMTSAPGGGRYQQRRNLAPETKYFDTAAEAVTLSDSTDWTGTEIAMSQRINENGTTITAYTSSSLNPSAIGSGFGQIIGQKYVIKKIRVRGSMRPVAQPDLADPQAASVVRLLLVQDTNPDGAQAQGEQVMTDFGNLPNVHSFLNTGSTLNKFKILADRRFILNPSVTATDGSNTGSSMIDGKVWSMSHTFKKPLIVTLKGPTTATPQTSQLQSCNIFLLAMCNGPASSMKMQVVSRCYFCE